MGFVLDIIILLIFAAFIVKNRTRPPLRCGLETCAALAAIIGAVPLAVGAAELCYSKLFRGALAHNLEETLGETSKLTGTFNHFNRVMEQMPSVVRNAAASYQIPTQENMNRVSMLVSGYTPETAGEIVDIVAQPVIQGIFRALFCAIFFYGLLYLAKGAAAVIENLLYSPDRTERNTVLSGVYGCFKGLITVVLFVTIIQFALPALPPLSFFNVDTLNRSFIFKMFYHQNILMLFLGKGIYPVTI